MPLVGFEPTTSSSTNWCSISPPIQDASNARLHGHILMMRELQTELQRLAYWGPLLVQQAEFTDLPAEVGKKVDR